MISRLKKNALRMAALLLIAALVFGFTAVDCHAWRCENAYIFCILTIGYSPASIYCMTGLIFCLKYIE